MKRALYMILVALAAGCPPSAPSAPDYVNDVEPILTANCTRCHGEPALGGSPATFRLDSYSDVGRGVQTLYGALSMSEFIAARAVTREDMPPYGPVLSRRQKDILKAWAESGAPLGGRPQNQPPTARLVAPAAPFTVDASVALTILVTDPDHEPLEAEVYFASTLAPTVHFPLATLGGGQRDVTWNTAGLPAGAYEVRATVNDSLSSVDVSLGTATVTHPGGDVAPTVLIGAPVKDAILPDSEAPFPVALTIADPNLGDVLTLTLRAAHGATTIPVAQNVPVARGAFTFPWDTRAVPAGTSWRLIATVSDGRLNGVAVSDEFIISHTTTTDTYASVKPIVDMVCARCHNARLPAGPDFGASSDLRIYRGRAWRKVIQQLEMPPPSYPIIFSDAHLLTDAERARIGQWLLAGAP